MSFISASTGVVLVSVAAAVSVTEWMLGAPGADLAVMAVTLIGTGLLGVIAALLTPRWFGRLGLRGQFMFLAGLGLALLAINVVVAAGLMFLSGHDLRLLFVLGAYAVVVTAIPIRVISNGAAARIGAVEAAAARIAGGDLGARVTTSGADEIARLGAEFNHMTDALEAANARRDQLETARRELFAAVSHDLRTPLASIQLMVEALNDGIVSDQETSRRYLTTMGVELGHLARLIDDLFELARIESGELQLRLEALSLESVVADAVAAFRPQVERASVRLSFDAGASGRAVSGDPARLSRVIQNLLSNALRHTPSDGAISLSTRAVPGAVELAVVDSGEGIPQEDLPFVFDRFFRGDRARSHSQGGSGLGLSIARAIVEAHGGRIWVEPGSTSGATVVFSLPLAE